METINLKNIFKETPLLGLFFLSIALSIITQSCAELDPDPEEFNVPPGVYTNQEEVDRAAAGMYRQIIAASSGTTFYAPAWAGDDMTTHSALNKADFREFDQRDVKSTNNRLLRNWNSINNAISSINAFLERSSFLIGQNIVDEELLTYNIGEAYFLRAFLRHQLSRVHGRIPLIEETFPPIESIVRAETIEEVYEQIESDLLEAEERLPNIFPDVLAGAPRPNNGSARAFLARLYMDWAGFPVKDQSKYELAVNSAKQVIDNSDIHQFALVNNLEDLWLVAQDKRFNTESIFTLAYCTSASGCSNNSNSNRKYGRLGLPSGTPNLQGWNETFAEIKFFEDFPEGARKESTYRLDLDWQTFSSQKSPVFKKIAGPLGDIALGVSRSFRNDYVMRYAEILLIYAEASGRSGNITSEAWEALNMIRRRAAGLDFSTSYPTPVPQKILDDNGLWVDHPTLMYTDVSSGDITELAFTERKWEFSGEYIRWNDLVRTERVEEALSDRDPAGPIQEHNPIIGGLDTSTYLAPIPLEISTQFPNL